MKISYRFLLPLLAVFCIAVTGAAHAQPVESVASLALYNGPDREQRLLQGARREGALTLYSTLPVGVIADLATAFEKKYGIKLKSWRAGSENVLQRIVTEARAGRNDFDVVETGSPELESLHREQLLQKAYSPYFADLLPQALQPHGEWVGLRLNMFVQAYNTKLVKKQDFPKSYQDLLDPKWKGKLGIEIDDVDWFGTIVKEMGEAKGLKLFHDIVATNGISVRKGHTQLAGMVSSGEVPFVLTEYNHSADKMKAKGAPVDWDVIPPAVVRVNGEALSKEPPHPYAAVLFYDFMLSDGQAILAKDEYLVTSRKAGVKAGSVLEKLQQMKLKLVDPATVLDEGDKWENLYEQTVTQQAH